MQVYDALNQPTALRRIRKREVLVLGICATRIIDLVLPRATEVVYSYPESFELLRLMDMEHMQVSNALNRQLYPAYASGRHLSQGSAINA